VKTFKTDELRVDAGASFLREGTRSEYLYTVLSGWAFRYKMCSTMAAVRFSTMRYLRTCSALQGALMNETQVRPLPQRTLLARCEGAVWPSISDNHGCSFAGCPQRQAREMVPHMSKDEFSRPMSFLNAVLSNS